MSISVPDTEWLQKRKVVADVCGCGHAIAPADERNEGTLERLIQQVTCSFWENLVNISCTGLTVLHLPCDLCLVGTT